MENTTFDQSIWMPTYSGGTFNFTDFKVLDIKIEDISQTLSKICRFNGHCAEFYSVAQHSVNCARIVRGGKYAVLGALLHDAHEAYVGDLITPIKWYIESKINISPLQELTDNIQRTINARFGLPAELPAEVYRVDLAMLAVEKRDLLLHDLKWEGDWNLHLESAPYGFEISECWTPQKAHKEFMKTFEEFYGA